MEVICNLYKTSGKWYGEHTFMAFDNQFPSDLEVVIKCMDNYTNPKEFVIHVTMGNKSRIILPS